jgi:hypothetical protein
MEQITKAIINVKEGILELEGSESFVTKYLEEYKHLINQNNNKNITTRIENDLIENKIPNKKNQIVQNTGGRKKKTSKVKDVSPEKFDITPEGLTSLESFMGQKKPGSSSREKVLVIGYYIKNILNLTSFSESNIEYAYRVLRLGNKPIHLRQLLTDIKNKNMEIDSIGIDWSINRIGEKFVDENLPKPDKK